MAEKMTKIIPIEIVLLKKNLNSFRETLNEVNDLWNQHKDEMSKKDKTKLFKIIKDHYKILKKSSVNLKKISK